MWKKLEKENTKDIEDAVALQKEQSEFYNRKVTFERVERKLTGARAYEIHVWDDDNFTVQIVTKPGMNEDMLHLQTCAVRYKGREMPYQAAVILLRKLKEVAGERQVYALWDNLNPEITERFYSAVANDSNAKEAGFTSAVTNAVPSLTKDKISYHTLWS